ncbi:hypothetical protein QUB04_17445 [Microcoleus sp. D2_18a_B4]
MGESQLKQQSSKLELGVRSQEPGEKSQKEEERSVFANMRCSQFVGSGAQIY